MKHEDMIRDLEALKCYFEEQSEAYPMCLEYAVKMLSKYRWIPVSERLPKPGEEVFVYLWGDVPYLASVNDEGQWETEYFYLDADDAPKAWMPLPEHYREVK